MLHKYLSLILIHVYFIAPTVSAQSTESITAIPNEHQALMSISSQAAVGDLDKLNAALHKGLDAGLTINQLKEALIHVHAYAGFPRSIRGLQTLMTVLEERKLRGIEDEIGKDASPILSDTSKYERGKAILQQLTGVQENDLKTGYAAFAPTIEVFLKEHLFADLFERDVLTYLERELVTISVLASIGRAEPMLKSHLNICIHLGYHPSYLQQFIKIIEDAQGVERAAQASKVLAEILHK